MCHRVYYIWLSWPMPKFSKTILATEPYLCASMHSLRYIIYCYQICHNSWNVKFRYVIWVKWIQCVRKKTFTTLKYYSLRYFTWINGVFEIWNLKFKNIYMDEFPMEEYWEGTFVEWIWCGWKESNVIEIKSTSTKMKYYFSFYLFT